MIVYILYIDGHRDTRTPGRTHGHTDRQADSSLPPKHSFCGGIKIAFMDSYVCDDWNGTMNHGDALTTPLL